MCWLRETDRSSVVVDPHRLSMGECGKYTEGFQLENNINYIEFCLCILYCTYQINKTEVMYVLIEHIIYQRMQGLRENKV